MPNFESALTLLSKVAMDKEDGYMKFPIYTFEFDTKLNEKVKIFAFFGKILDFVLWRFNVLTILFLYDELVILLLVFFLLGKLLDNCIFQKT